MAHELQWLYVPVIRCNGCEMASATDLAAALAAADCAVAVTDHYVL